ncbi:MAG: redoxin domain-containing protein [Thermoguttaceae bacterium]
MTRCNAGLLVFAFVFGLVQAVGCEKRPGSLDTSAADAKVAGPTNSTTADAKASGASSASLTAHAVLEKMAEAYRNASTYEDFATAELLEAGSTEPRRADFKVAFERPNKLRIKFYQGEVACDGKKWYAFCRDIPDQAVLREAPEKLKLQMLQADTVLNQALDNGFAGASPQLLLLLEEKPLTILLDGVRDQDLTLDEPGRIGDYDCYRVRFSRNEGTGEYWIDQKTFVLRQMRFRQSSAPPGRDGDSATESVSMVANFERARLGGAIEPLAFKFEVPETVQCHRALMDPGPYGLIGKKLPDFQITDMQGKPWSSQALTGKVVALHLWRSNAEVCLPVIPSLQQAYDKVKDNEKAAVWAINVDSSQVEAKTIEETARQWKLSVPILRDPNLETPKLLRISALPATFFLDSKGVLQDCIVGDSPLAAAATTRKLEKLLAGEELAGQALNQFQQRFKEYEKEVDLQFSGEAQTATIQQGKPAPPAAKSEPKKLRLTTLWKCTAISTPGNILVVGQSGGKSRIYVIDGYKAITEIALDGTIAASPHRANLADEELFTLLRTAAGSDGKRYFAAFAPWQQRFHLFDENFKYLLSYPENALENRNPGLTDVELGDLDGDGKIKAYVGFGGSVGVKCVSPQGKLIWSCRNLFNVGRVLPGPANAQGHRELFCISDANSLATLDATGQLRDAARLPSEGILQSVVYADLAGNGQETWCGMIHVPDNHQIATGRFTAVGLNTKGELIWKYELPFGTQQPVEPIVVGRILPGTTGQWLLPGSDGSIHVLAADGTPIDHFNYGSQVSGLATVEIDGKPVLLISSANGVEALRVE